MAFVVKTPLYPFHVWLYQAHVESPVARSVLLARLVLKLATYRLVVVLWGALFDATLRSKGLIFAFCGLSLLSSSASVLRQVDVKAVIAISSVGHMSVVTLGILAGSPIAFEGRVLLAIAHAFVSPMLFSIVRGILYDQIHSRVVRYVRRVALLMPLLAIVYFRVLCANIGVPPSLNWAGELLVLIGVFERSALMAFVVSFSVIVGAGYSILLYTRMAYGEFSVYLRPLIDLRRLEAIVHGCLIALTYLRGVCLSSTLSAHVN